MKFAILTTTTIAGASASLRGTIQSRLSSGYQPTHPFFGPSGTISSSDYKCTDPAFPYLCKSIGCSNTAWETCTQMVLCMTEPTCLGGGNHVGASPWVCYEGENDSIPCPEIEIDYCATNPCADGETCIDSPDPFPSGRADGYTCVPERNCDYKDTTQATGLNFFTELVTPLREELLPDGTPYLTSTDRVDANTGFVTFTIEARSDTTVQIAGKGSDISFFEPDSTRTGNTDSFYAKMDDGDQAIWTGIRGTNFDEWVNLPGSTVCTVSSGCGSSNGLYTLERGEHTLTIQIRENGSSMTGLSIVDGDAGFCATPISN